MTDASTTNTGQHRKGKVNDYGYTERTLKDMARRAGAPRIHKLTGVVVDRILESNMRNVLRVAATRACIAKHHTVQLEYLANAVKLANGVHILGHRTAGQQWKAGSASARKKKQKNNNNKRQPERKGD